MLYNYREGWCSLGGDAMYTPLHLIKEAMWERIEEDGEMEFEKARFESYTEGKEKFREEIESLPNNDKESLRITLMRELVLQDKDIEKIWEKIVNRAAIYQYIFGTLPIILSISSFISLLMLNLKTAFIFVALSISMSLITRMQNLYAAIMYYTTLNWHLTGKLYDAYKKHGEDEARLELADYRNILGYKNQEHILITPHEISLPEA